MIEWIRTWLLSLVGATLVLTILYSILPKSPIRPVARSIGMLILTLVLIRPLLNTQFEQLTFAYDRAQQLIDQQVEAYREENRAQYEEIIAERVAAYIQDRGVAYGVSCHPKVTFRWQENVPLRSTGRNIPVSVIICTSGR